jgi:hypothetical protein
MLTTSPLEFPLSLELVDALKKIAQERVLLSFCQEHAREVGSRTISRFSFPLPYLSGQHREQREHPIGPFYQCFLTLRTGNPGNPEFGDI